MRGHGEWRGTRWRAQSLAHLATLVPLMWTTSARAEELAQVEVIGDCPGRAVVATALAGRHLPEGARAYALGVRAFAGGADVTLTNTAAEVVLERRLVSDDCTAMADAAAEIVTAYFVALAAREAPSGIATNAAAGVSVENPAIPTPPPLRPPEPPPPRALEAEPAPAPPPTREPAPRRFSVALAWAVELFPQGPNAAASGALGLGIGITRRLELEARGVLGSSTTLGEAPDSVLRAEHRITLRALTWLGSMPRVAVVGGAGAAATRVRALGLDTAPVEVVWSPVVEGGVALDVPLGAGFSLRAELGCHALFLRENYVVNGTESIGEGPAFGCSLGGGAAWTSAHK